MKIFFSVVFTFLFLFSFGFAQEKISPAEKHIREIFSELSIKIQTLETIFLVPGNMHIESGDASLALVELEQMQVQIKNLEGRVETMEFEMRFQMEYIKNLTKKLSVILESNSNILNLSQEDIISLDEDFYEKRQPSHIIKEVSPHSEFHAFQQVELLFENGEFLQAEDNYNNFITNFPNSASLPEAFYQLARTQYKLEKWKDAANSYLEAFSLDPKGNFAPKALFGLSISLGALKEFDQACLTLEEVYLRFPSQNVISESEIMQTKDILNCP